MSVFVENSKGYSAKIIADSVSAVHGKRVTTLELVYPRIIHSELMTHSLFAKNAASSRAIPVGKLIDMVRTQPAEPYRFGQHQAGMQDQGVEFEGIVKAFGLELSGRDFWNLCADEAADNAEALFEAGFAKQICNRLLEPFQFMKTVVTATEFANFFWLRLDKDADPTICELARLMKQAMEESQPEALDTGEWHTPYVEHRRNAALELCYFASDVEVSLEDAKAISSSCCAQVSYRVLNNTKEKALDVYGKLLSGNKVHASPFQHPCTPMPVLQPKIFFNGNGDVEEKGHILEGTTHIDMKGNAWSGNLMGFVQLRQTLKNHTVW